MDFELYKSLIGVPYRENGRDRSGFDCYGLVLFLGKANGLDMPESLYLEERADRHGLFEDNVSWFECVDTPQFGDLATFRHGKFVTHVGMMIDRFRFIHATKPSGTVISSLDSLLYKNKLEGFYRWKN
jgi:probable lipoprotein NlpC